MRKQFIYTFFLFLLFSTACTKTYTCGCSDGTPDNIQYTKEVTAENKSEAQEKCANFGFECELISN